MIETTTNDTTQREVTGTGGDETEDGAGITETKITDISEDTTSTAQITTVTSDNTPEILDNTTITSDNATIRLDNTTIEVDNTTDSEAGNMTTITITTTTTTTTTTIDLATLYDILFSEQCQREQLSVEVSQIPTNPRNVHILNMYPRRRTATPGYITQTSQTCGTTLTVQILASHTSVPSFLSATSLTAPGDTLCCLYYWNYDTQS